MARTAHHIRRPLPGGAGPRGAPFRAVTVVDLRYSAACLREGRRAGRRARPAVVRSRAAVYSWARADLRDRWVSRQAGIEEGRARGRLRLELETIRRAVNATTGGRLAVEAAEELDVAPARHRRGAVWLY
ncbi:hypothetical protein [Nonomuraea roseoviolacea]|uniref:Transposase n=1 Tax=Nonomuraea roseoviolacea subsp. carminata TaxID=160689 RepID=A0ABT1KDQ1_9ACTN|nr:hypothetical protein [Nonomuraea roseoviolacea]MCP2351486.1 hypothetical protein [Nonomuraea roseoviolacea subsp. carminata]